MAKKTTFKFEAEELRINMRELPGKVRDASDALIDDHAVRTEAYMKGNAPWTDNTGAARAGLQATTVSAAAETSLSLSHSVSYGIYLETAYSGRYRIIVPTMLRAGNELMVQMDHLMRKI